MTEDDKYKQFVNLVVNSKKNTFKITNSIGVYDGFKYYRKTRPKDKAFIVTATDYYKIHRMVNNKMAQLFLQGQTLRLPHGMGIIELRRYDAFLKIKGDKVFTNRPIDWKTTLQLWFEDRSAYDKRLLIKLQEDSMFKVHYDKVKSTYNNKIFYQFKMNVRLKRQLKAKIKNKEIDAFEF